MRWRCCYLHSATFSVLSSSQKSHDLLISGSPFIPEPHRIGDEYRGNRIISPLFAVQLFVISKSLKTCSCEPSPLTAKVTKKDESQCPPSLGSIITERNFYFTDSAKHLFSVKACLSSIHCKQRGFNGLLMSQIFSRLNASPEQKKRREKLK